MHLLAAAGFASAGDAYHRGRPGYPQDAIALLVRHLGLGPGVAVLELGAGTGKLTRHLAATGASVTAVEPVADMRRVLVERVPGVTTLDAVAEALPVGDGSVDAVVAGQAFHWFATGPAVSEIARALRPGGGLGLVWNARDVTSPWVAEIDEILDAVHGDAPSYRTGAWREPFRNDDRFTPLQHATVHHRQVGDVTTLHDRFASISSVAALPPARHDDVMARIDAVVARNAVDGLVTLPYRTDVYWATRR